MDFIHQIIYDPDILSKFQAAAGIGLFTFFFCVGGWDFINNGHWTKEDFISHVIFSFGIFLAFFISFFI